MSVRKVVKKTVKNRLNPNLIKDGKFTGEATKFAKGNKLSVGHGRPKLLPALDLLVAEALGIPEGGDYKKSNAFKIINKLQEMAAKGHVRAAEIVMDRGWGRVQQTLDVTTAGKEIGPGVTQIFNNAPPLAGDEKDIKP